MGLQTSTSAYVAPEHDRVVAWGSVKAPRWERWGKSSEWQRGTGANAQEEGG